MKNTVQQQQGNDWFPGFPHPASDITEYICGADFVVVATRDEQMVRYGGKAVAAFKDWLDSNGVPDITSQAGAMVVGYYSGQK